MRHASDFPALVLQFFKPPARSASQAPYYSKVTTVLVRKFVSASVMAPDLFVGSTSASWIACLPPNQPNISFRRNTLPLPLSPTRPPPQRSFRNLFASEPTRTFSFSCRPLLATRLNRDNLQLFYTFSHTSSSYGELAHATQRSLRNYPQTDTEL